MVLKAGEEFVLRGSDLIKHAKDAIGTLDAVLGVHAVHLEWEDTVVDGVFGDPVEVALYQCVGYSAHLHVPRRGIRNLQGDSIPGVLQFRRLLLPGGDDCRPREANRARVEVDRALHRARLADRVGTGNGRGPLGRAVRIPLPRLARVRAAPEDRAGVQHLRRPEVATRCSPPDGGLELVQLGLRHRGGRSHYVEVHGLGARWRRERTLVVVVLFEVNAIVELREVHGAHVI
mmetsp:Transcript_34833/g.108360  ORF Transcript_34833/g.108360 Transcript_34833/m.108360 type:complete len:232 (-) Transcript_34833:1267-1962(-)